MRDALSLLDQCIAFYLGQKLTYDHVLEVLGAVDTDVFSKLLRQILERNVAAVLETVEELVMQGRELTQLTNDFTWYLRNLLLMKSSDNMEDVLDVSTENMRQLKEEAEMVEGETLFRYIRIFSELSNQMRYAVQKRILLEVALIKLCRPQMETNQDSILDRVRTLEERVESGDFGGPVQGNIVYANEEKQAEPKERPKLEKAIPEDIREVVKNFRSIVNEAGGLLKGYLKGARLSLGGEDRLLLVLPDELSADFVNQDIHKRELTDLIEERIGKTVTLDIRSMEEGRRFEESFVDIEKVVKMEITIED